MSPSVSSAVRAKLVRLGNLALDKVLRMETAEMVWHEQLGFAPSEGVHYQASNWVNQVQIWRLLHRMGVSQDDALLDIGCGKGQVLIFASRMPFGRVVGIDRSESMVSAARRNLETTRVRTARSRVEVHVANAVDYEIPADITVCYLFNPFPIDVLEAVLDNIETSLLAHPRTIRIIYLLPPEIGPLLSRGYRVASRTRRLYLFIGPTPAELVAKHASAPRAQN